MPFNKDPKYTKAKLSKDSCLCNKIKTKSKETMSIKIKTITYP